MPVDLMAEKITPPFKEKNIFLKIGMGNSPFLSNTHSEGSLPETFPSEELFFTE